MDRRKFMGSLGAGFITLGLAGCGLINSGNNDSLEGNSSQTPDNPTTSKEQLVTSTGNSNETLASQTKKEEGAANTSGTESTGNPNINNEQTNSTLATHSILVAYFSHTGNTRKIANLIHEKVGGDIFEIITVDPYPDDHDTCLTQAYHEEASNYRPQLKTKVEKMNSYDVVFVGYPIWTGTMPMALFSFLEKYNLSQKTILPFSTCRASGLAQTVNNIKQLCPQSTVLKGLSIKRDDIDTSQNAVLTWLRSTGITK